jgi:ABC-type iron transport system FetAB ATPase subunit
MKLTKMDMAKVIVTALYNFSTVEEAVTFPIVANHAKKLARAKKEDIIPQYELAKRILEDRIKKEGG